MEAVVRVEDLIFCAFPVLRLNLQDQFLLKQLGKAFIRGSQRPLSSMSLDSSVLLMTSATDVVPENPEGWASSVKTGRGPPIFLLMVLS